ncbi:hypothetical protein ID853_15295 [Xenorhabdus sp. Vera]|nr:hypothetical protein [Xenorhabdus sp. Vera]
MQQKNCFFYSFAHKTIAFDDIDYFLNSFSSNNKQKDLRRRKQQMYLLIIFGKLFASPNSFFEKIKITAKK